MQEKYIPLYKDLYTTFEQDDKKGHMVAIAGLAVDIAQDIVNFVTVTPLSAPAIMTACKLVIKIISETPRYCVKGTRCVHGHYARRSSPELDGLFGHKKK